MKHLFRRFIYHTLRIRVGLYSEDCKEWRAHVTFWGIPIMFIKNEGDQVYDWK